MLGGYLTKIKYHNHDSSHYRNLKAQVQGFSGIIVGPVNERAKHYRYDLELNQLVANDSIISTEGRIHLYILKDSLTEPLSYGQGVNVSGNFFPISGPGNPSEFDYKQYLERQNIYAHAFVRKHDVEILIAKPLNKLLGWAYRLRGYANEIIDKNIPEPRENGIAKALLLGIKDHLDNDMKKAYSAAGAMHVLAVSGLHVGIVFLIIKLLIGRLKESGLWGKYLFGLCSVSIIWLYACVTGLSPSVLRAATMFSLVALSEASVRETNIYNSLGLAAFILLCFDPYLIYSVGFQLSFAAVIGIVYLQPKLYRMIEFRFFLLDKAWSITCVSIAAQLATFPLTAYYFHQFPTYFLVSNLIVIPASFLMLTSGLVMLIVAPVSSTIGVFIGVALQKFMWGINELISLVHILPNSLIEWIYLDFEGLVLIYAIVVSLSVGLHYGIFRTLIVSCVLLLFLLGWNINRNEVQSGKNQLIFYDIKDKLAIDYIQGHTARLYIDAIEQDEIELLSYQINPNRLSSGLRPVSEDISTFMDAHFFAKDVIRQGVIGNKRLLIFDSTTFHLNFSQPIKTDFVIINNGAIKSLKWLRNNFDFDLVIVSSRNSFYYSRKMTKQAEELGLNLHSIKENGACNISLK